MAPLTVISGCMFAGKSESLLRLIHRSQIAGQRVQVFKPEIDDRYRKQHINAHNGFSHPAQSIGNPQELLAHLSPSTNLVAIDEVQFLDASILDVIHELRFDNIEVIVAGLALDFKAEPFGSMPTLLALADHILHVTAICTHPISKQQVCGQAATRTQRLINGKPASRTSPLILIGANESYQARCLKHYQLRD